MKFAKLFGLATALSLSCAGVASSATIDTDQWYGFRFDGAGTPISAGVGIVLPSNPGGIAAPSGPWTFSLARPGVLTVLDLFATGDRFSISNFGTLLGTTSVGSSGKNCRSDIACALNNPAHSRGIFNLAAGNYSITGTQIAGVSGGGAFRVDVAAVPVPAAGLLLIPGLALMAGIGRKSRKTAA